MPDQVRDRRTGSGWDWLLLAGSVLPLLGWTLANINADFWYDEITTLQNYVLVPLARTVTDYSLPNNHVLFSLLANAWLRLVGIGDLTSLLARPWVIRLLPLLFTTVGIWYLWRSARALAGRTAAFMPVLVLCTSVPFANFATQVRGFSLSIMLLSMLLYHFLAFRQKPGPGHATGIAVAVALALYAIPLNLYFILALALVAALGLLTTRAERRAARTPVLTLLFLGIGTGLAALFYAPVLRSVVSNPYVQSRHPFFFPTLFATMPRVLLHFVSFRYLLVALALAGIVLLLRSRGRIRPLLDTVLLLLLPFLLSFVRGDQPVQRVFVNLLPAFALLIGLGLKELWSRWKPLRERALPGAVLLIVYCQATFGFALYHMATRLRRDIGTTRKAHDIFYAYYQAHYRPRQLLAGFNRVHYDRHTPVVTFDVDQAAMPVYLSELSIPHDNAAAFEPMLTRADRLYVITALPDRFRTMMARAHPEFAVERLNREIDFHNVFLLTRTGRGLPNHPDRLD